MTQLLRFRADFKRLSRLSTERALAQDLVTGGVSPTKPKNSNSR